LEWRAKGRGVTLRADVVCIKGIYILMPKESAILIEYALKKGWNPDGTQGTQFCLTSADKAEELEDFVLIDVV